MSRRTILPADLNPIETNALLCGGVAPRPIALASAEWPDGVDEFPKCGLTPGPARFIGPALVEESPFQMECRLKQSPILTGNDLGLLANSPGLPDLSAMVRRPGDPLAPGDLEDAIHRALDLGDLDEAWRLVGLRLKA